MILLSLCRLITSPFFHICHRVMFYYERDIATKIYHSTKPVVHNDNNYECCFKCCNDAGEENTSLLGNVIDV